MKIGVDRVAKELRYGIEVLKGREEAITRLVERVERGGGLEKKTHIGTHGYFAHEHSHELSRRVPQINGSLSSSATRAKLEWTVKLMQDSIGMDRLDHSDEEKLRYKR